MNDIPSQNDTPETIAARYGARLKEGVVITVCTPFTGTHVPSPIWNGRTIRYAEGDKRSGGHRNS